MFDCCVVRFVSPFLKKKSNFQNGQKSRENRTNMDIILSFLAKPVDKHGITLVYITYPPWGSRAEPWWGSRGEAPGSSTDPAVQSTKKIPPKTTFFVHFCLCAAYKLKGKIHLNLKN